jgi:F0F1-type ATP synthase membrane subunit b/b'
MAESLRSVAFSSVNFILFFGALILILRKPLSNFLSKRKETYISDSNNSQKLREEAQKRLEDISYKFKNIEQDGRVLLLNAEKEGVTIGETVLAESQKLSSSIINEGKQRIHSERTLAWRLLKDNFITQLIRSAKDDISLSITNKQRTSYINESKNMSGASKGLGR